MCVYWACLWGSLHPAGLPGRIRDKRRIHGKLRICVRQRIHDRERIRSRQRIHVSRLIYDRQRIRHSRQIRNSQKILCRQIRRKLWTQIFPQTLI